MAGDQDRGENKAQGLGEALQIGSPGAILVSWNRNSVTNILGAAPGSQGAKSELIGKTLVALARWARTWIKNRRGGNVRLELRQRLA